MKISAFLCILVISITVHATELSGRIIFTCLDKENNFSMDIFSMKPDGTDIQQITDKPGREWCPCTTDGTNIYFVADYEGRTQIRSINTETRKIAEVGSAYIDIYDLSISKNGAKLVFSAFDNNNPENDFDIYMMNTDGTDLKKLLEHEGPDTLPRFSPDMSAIVFQSQRDNGFQSYHMDLESGKVKLLTKKSNCKTFSPCFTPDGNGVIFTRSDKYGSNGIFYSDLSGNNVRAIYKGKDGEMHPFFSPDGKTIVFAMQNQSLMTQLYLVEFDGSNLRRITDAKKFYMFPFWVE